MNPIVPRRALLSVSDKTDLLPLARALRKVGCEIYASGGTKKALDAEGIESLAVETLSRSPEAFQGRMKTLSFPIFGGILARRGDASDDADRDRLGIPQIDLVAVNFYPFEKAAEGASEGELTELIDIGGPALVRAAAKNREHVLVLCSPSLYAEAIRELETKRGIGADLRKRAAIQAWQAILAYDDAIAKRMGGGSLRTIELRYGENPHQKASFEFSPESSPIAWDRPCTESSLSYNNILDFTAGFRLLADLAQWTRDQHGERGRQAAHAVIIKHQNPCGVATDLDGRLDLALEMAWAGDPVSAFGGMVLVSRPLDTAAAKFLESRFIEGLAAPELSRDSSALSILITRRKNLKAIPITNLDFREEHCLVSVPGGTLTQSGDTYEREALDPVTDGAWSPDKTELAQFGILVAKSLKSNSIAIVESPAEGRYRLIGAGQGQPNRIEALAKLAIPRALSVLAADAKANLSGTDAFVLGRLGEAVLVSDAFFPFSDGVEAAAKAGIRFVVEPGGSVRDGEVIAKAKELGLNLAFTGRRHFRH
jgi:phosphoribosylaminoimidazolecarboxamide formyltransferase/IMP cyclohydrolase